MDGLTPTFTCVSVKMGSTCTEVEYVAFCALDVAEAVTTVEVVQFDYQSSLTTSLTSKTFDFEGRPT